MKVKDLQKGDLFLYYNSVCIADGTRLKKWNNKYIKHGWVVWELTVEKTSIEGTDFWLDEDTDVKYFRRLGIDENTATIKLALVKCSSADEGMEG